MTAPDAPVDWQVLIVPVTEAIRAAEHAASGPSVLVVVTRVGAAVHHRRADDLEARGFAEVDPVGSNLRTVEARGLEQAHPARFSVAVPFRVRRDPLHETSDLLRIGDRGFSACGGEIDAGKRIGRT